MILIYANRLLDQLQYHRLHILIRINAYIVCFDVGSGGHLFKNTTSPVLLLTTSPIWKILHSTFSR